MAVKILPPLYSENRDTGYMRDTKSDVARRFYGSQKWRETSLRYRSKHPWCVECEKEGRFVRADCVDHIVQIENGGAKFDESNLQSMCDHHHGQKRQREMHEKRKAQSIDKK